jgi:hypothetical protein
MFIYTYIYIYIYVYIHIYVHIVGQFVSMRDFLLLKKVINFTRKIYWPDNKGYRSLLTSPHTEVRKASELITSMALISTVYMSIYICIYGTQMFHILKVYISYVCHIYTYIHIYIYIYIYTYIHIGYDSDHERVRGDRGGYIYIYIYISYLDNKYHIYIYIYVYVDKQIYLYTYRL